MVTVFDAPADKLIKHVKMTLKEMEEIAPPEWAPYVKTGVHRERAPVDEDWWYERSAAVLRKVYMDGPIGIVRLAQHFGGPRDRGAKPNKAATGSRSIERKILQQLEAATLVVADEKNRGRLITPEGRRLMDNHAYDVVTALAEEREELKKYLGGKKK